MQELFTNHRPAQQNHPLSDLFIKGFHTTQENNNATSIQEHFNIWTVWETIFLLFVCLLFSSEPEDIVTCFLDTTELYLVDTLNQQKDN